MKKIVTLDGSESPETLLQRIAESEVFDSADNYSPAENSIFEKHNRLCYLLNDLEFTIENYGLVNFFTEYSDQVPELEELGILLREFDHSETIAAIQKALEYFTTNRERFDYLESDPDDYDEIYDQLEVGIKSLDGRGGFHIPLHQSIKSLVEIIRKNPSDFYTLAN